MIAPRPSICDVLPGAAALLGVAGADDRLGLLDHVGPRQQVVVVLVDGLGLQLLPRLAPHAPLLAAVLERRVGRLQPMTSVFPSTTPTNLVSFATGALPGDHGVLGFRVRLPGTSRTLTHLLWRDDPPPASWQPVPTWFERLARAGRSSAVALPAAFESGGLTSAAYRGATFAPLPANPAGTAPDVSTIGELLGAGVELVFGYTDVLDSAAHHYGIASEQWIAAARRVDAFLTALSRMLPSRAALLVTADHGGLDVPADRRIDLSADPVLAADVDVVAGEPRVRYLHTRPGARDDVAAAWRGSLGDRVTVRTRTEAIDAGWFGSVRREHEARIGDVVVICEDDTAILASAHEPPGVSELIGFHGSLTPVETEIPLIAVTPD